MAATSWSHFIQDLAILLVVAACVNIVLGRFRIPIFLGYLVAGVAVGSGLTFFLPTVTSSENLRLWSEIGIIFLLFTIGLEFSLPEFFKLGANPIKTGIFETLAVLGILFGTLMTLGLSWAAAAGITACFATSSTAIIMKSFQEYNLKGLGFVKHVFGLVVFEDLAVIILLLLLPTLAATHLFSGALLFEQILQVFSFLFFSLLIGVIVLPKLHHPLKRLTPEGLMIFGAGVALFLASVSFKAGLSFGIGAFIAGSLLSQVPKREQIIQNIEPIRNLFMAIFFVATGMLLKVEGIEKALLPAVALTVLVVAVKFLAVTIGSLLSRESFKNSVKAAVTMIVMGEFSLLTAQLALSLKLITPFHFQVVVLSVFLNILVFTFTFRFYDKIADWIHAKTPKGFLDIVDSYREPSASAHRSSLDLFREYYFSTFALNIVLIGIMAFVTHKSIQIFDPSHLYRSLIILAGLTLSLPMFWALLFYQPHLSLSQANQDRDRLQRYQGVFFLARVILTIPLFILIGAKLLGLQSSLILLVATLLVLKLMKKELGYLHRLLFKKLKANFTDTPSPIKSPAQPTQKVWEAQVTELTVSPNSSLAGITLLESRFREKYNVLITAIDRGGRRIYAPSRHDRLFPGDRLLLVGDEEAILTIRPLVEVTNQELTSEDLYDSFGLESFDVPENSPLSGQSIRDSFFRDKSGSLIVGIERQGERILNPHSNTQIHAGDRLWLAGEQKELKVRIAALEELCSIAKTQTASE